MEVGTARCTAPEQDNGRALLSTKRKQRAEIGIRREEDTSLPGGKIEQIRIAGTLKPAAANVDRVVAGLGQQLSQAGR